MNESAFSDSRLTEPKRLVSLIPVTILGVVLSAAAALLQAQYEHEAALQRFTAAADARFLAIKASFVAAAENLHSVEALFFSSEVVTRAEFGQFAASVVARHPKIRSLMWVPRVSHEARADYEGQTIRLFERSADGALIAASSRPEHFPAHYVEPEESCSFVQGLDFASNPELMKVLNHARDSGRLSAYCRDCRKGVTVADQSGLEYLVIRPVYQPNAAISSISERRSNLYGFVIGVFRLASLVETGLRELPPGSLDLWLYGDPASLGKHLLYYHASRTRPTDTAPASKTIPLPDSGVMSLTRDLPVADLNWEVVAAATPEFGGEQEWEAWTIFITGTVLTGMLVIYLSRVRKANARALEAGIMLRTILDTIPARVFWKDTDLRYLGCNRLFAQDGGVDDPSELIGLNDYDVAWAENAEDYRADDRRVLKTLEPYLGFEEEQVRPSGEVAYLVTSKAPLRDATGKVIGVLGTYEDITERKGIEARLNQAQKMEAVGQLTGGIAHDFNNILTTIIGNLDLLQRTITDPKGLERLENATRATLRGASLTQRLLAFSRRQTLEPKVTDVNELIEGLYELLNRTLGETVELQTALAEDISHTMIDPAQLENSLLNLAINARDAMPVGGQLTIETAKATFDEEYAKTYPYVTPGAYIMVAVSDTGTGMPPDIADKVFEPFFTTKDVGKGTGLGLSMVYGFVKQSKGHIHLYSEPDHGTSVKIYLPEWDDDVASPTVPDSGVQEDAATCNTESATILVVEDDADVREVAVGNLEELGYRLLVASNGPEAMEIVEALPEGERIDLLFSDVVMPGGMTGPELAIEVKKHLPQIKVLFTSGNPRNAFERNHGANGGAPLLVKPYRNDELARAVSELMSGQDAIKVVSSVGSGDVH